MLGILRQLWSSFVQLLRLLDWSYVYASQLLVSFYCLKVAFLFIEMSFSLKGLLVLVHFYSFLCFRFLFVDSTLFWWWEVSSAPLVLVWCWDDWDCRGDGGDWVFYVLLSQWIRQIKIDNMQMFNVLIWNPQFSTVLQEGFMNMAFKSLNLPEGVWGFYLNTLYDNIYRMMFRWCYILNYVKT